MRVILFFLFMTPYLVMAQNLVPNGSFEDTLCVDQGDPSFFGAEHWFNPNDATPDYYSFWTNSECDLYNILDPAFEGIDFQIPSDGSKMIGLYCGDSSSCSRDYVQAQLSKSLVSGETYCVQLDVSLSNMSTLSTDCIGAAFTSEAMTNYEDPCWFDIPLSVSSDGGQIINDTLIWVTIQADYIASGSELYITVGNTKSNQECQFQEEPGTKSFPLAYYYFDNIRVVHGSCSNSVEEKELVLELFPNPSDGQVHVRCSNASHLRIHTAAGFLVYASQEAKFEHTPTIGSLATGMYLITISDEKSRKTQRLIVLGTLD